MGKKIVQEAVRFDEKVKRNGGRICPIHFDENLRKTGGKTCPIRFFETESGPKRPMPEPMCPIYFTGNKVEKDGKVTTVRVPEELAGTTIISPGVSDVFAFLRQNKSEQVGDRIIRPDEKEAIPPKRVTGANYVLTPLFRKAHYDRYGNREAEFDTLVVRIEFTLRTGKFIDQFEVKCNNIANLITVIETKYTYAVSGTYKEKSQIIDEFRECSAGLFEYSYFRAAGWHLIGGQHLYLYKNAQIKGINVLTSLDLPALNLEDASEAADIFWKARLLYRDERVIDTLLLYALLGVSYRLFDESGYPPHFLLFLYGKTGSFKTALAKVLFTQLCDERYRKYPRRIDADTPTSLEIALTKSGCDTVTLIDDYAPAKSEQQKKEMARKLEMIIRLVGDGSSKSRSNPNLEDCRGEGLKGTVALTGELRGTGLSSNLRCLYCEAQKENVNTEVLTYFQQNERLFSTLIKNFANYLSQTWDAQVEFIKRRFENERAKARNFVQAGRLIDTLVTMWIMAELAEDFLRNYCGEKKDFDLWKQNAKEGAVFIVRRSEMISTEEEPGLLFMRMLVTLLHTGQIRVTNTKENLLLTDSDGFFDTSSYYFLPERIYKKIVAEINSTGKYWGMDLEQIAKTLCDERYIVPISNGNQKKTYYARVNIGEHKKVKFFKISERILERVSEADF